eukprot:1116355-Rhodomonas_salina.1
MEMPHTQQSATCTLHARHMCTCPPAHTHTHRSDRDRGQTETETETETDVTRQHRQTELLSVSIFASLPPLLARFAPLPSLSVPLSLTQTRPFHPAA